MCIQNRSLPASHDTSHSLYLDAFCLTCICVCVRCLPSILDASLHLPTVYLASSAEVDQTRTTPRTVTYCFFLLFSLSCAVLAFVFIAKRANKTDDIFPGIPIEQQQFGSFCPSVRFVGIRILPAEGCLRQPVLRTTNPQNPFCEAYTVGSRNQRKHCVIVNSGKSLALLSPIL